MSAHIHVGLVFHMHQPVGNYGFVFEELYEKSYEPLLACLERHPGVKAGLHYSGPLLDWMLAERPEYLQRVRALVQRGQVEMLGGGYYEPVLPAISAADRVGQMVKMRTAVAELFGAEPTGMWLPERVWEPGLPESISAAGYSWTIVDDVHFEGAGFRAEDLAGWYLTESDGVPIGVFASSTRLRYLVPWGTVEDCIDFLRAAGDRQRASLVMMGDDGEKFGGWPTTYKHCWEDGWVDAFFSRLEAEAHWISTVKIGEWQASEPPAGLAYLPATSYMEMGEWSLPPAAQHDLEAAKKILREHGRDDLTRFVRGGHWRNFLARYPEVNLLHKRIMVLSRDAHQVGASEALDHLWQAECNCPFWHGVFGGVYLEHVRHANFGHTAVADALLHPGCVDPDVRDWDFDGRDEVCLRSERHAIVVAPEQGGAIEHWDLRQKGWHMTHTVARRPEAYHTGLSVAEASEVRSIHDTVRVKDPEALAHLGTYDRGMRLGAQETVLGQGATREDYHRERLAATPVVTSWEAAGQRIEMILSCGADRLSKRLSVGSGLAVEMSVPARRTLFQEWNLSLPGGADGGDPTFAFAPGKVEISTAIFRLCAAHSANEAWCERLYSVSNTEDGVELAPQGWCVVFRSEAGDGDGALSLEWTVTQ
jgi:4-alpha-glucanotransferase